MSKEVKKMSIKEFREIGFLQELNRRFLHPLGMALEVTVDDKTGEEALGRIWDCRDDPEGVLYALQNSEQERIVKFLEKRAKVQAIMDVKKDERQRNLGFFVEPIPFLKPNKGQSSVSLCDACMDPKDAFSLECLMCPMKME
jgi:hypothetical protein